MMTMRASMIVPLASALLMAALAHAETPQQLVTKAETAFDRSDIIAAMKYYRRAADTGYTPAMIRLAYLLDKSEDNEAAVGWYRKAADKGDAEAQFELARMYAEGEGVEKDFTRAYSLFEKSADNHYMPAIRVLALAHEKGELGVRIDFETARSWLEKGEKLDDYWAINRLLIAFKKGELGLRIDNDHARSLQQKLATIEAGETP